MSVVRASYQQHSTRYFLCLFVFFASILFFAQVLPLHASEPKNLEEAKAACETINDKPEKKLLCEIYLSRGDSAKLAECKEKIRQDCYAAALEKFGPDKGAVFTGQARQTRIDFSSLGLGRLNPLRQTSVSGFAGRIISVLIGIIGTIALAMTIYGGVLWMFSQGNSEKAAKATKIIVWSGLGVAVILSSYAIINFIVEAFTP